MATVQLKQVRKSYGAFEIIKGLDLTIHDRELIVFVGPSGCGKSTLLRLIAGLEEITSGDLLIDGQRVNDIAPARRGLALVFQSYALYPHMTVAENMGFSLKLSGMPKGERERKVLEAARILHLETFLNRKPRELSGGQRQRVAIGRAIVRNPRVFLFDEPLSNLDAALRVKMRLELTNLHRQLNATTIYVTHDQVEAMTMADRIVILQAGSIEQEGSPMEIYRNPKNLFVAGFIGSPRMNFLPVVTQDVKPSCIGVALEDGTTISLPVAAASATRGEKMTLGIRPEHIALTSENGLPATVQLVEHFGAESYLHTQLSGGEPVVVKVDGETKILAGQAVRLTMTDRNVHLFGPDGEALQRLPLGANLVGEPTASPRAE